MTSKPRAYQPYNLLEYNMSNQNQHGVVLYTDGGARPNPGNAGYGVHGYFYNKVDQTDTPKATVLDHFVTESGYLLKVKKTDTDVLVEPAFYVDATYALPGIRTNNYAELSAILAGYKIAIELYQRVSLMDEPKTLFILTDSKYALQSVTQWIKLWEKNDWKKRDGSPIENIPLMQALVTHERVLKEQYGFVKIQYQHISAHVGLMGNERADELASMGVRYSLDLQNPVHAEAADGNGSTTISASKGYWTNSVERNPYMDKKRIFFNTSEEYIEPGYYYQSDSGGSDFIHGKRLAEAGYSVLRLKEPDPAVELVRQRACQFSQDIVSISMVHVDQLFNKKVHSDIRRYGMSCLTAKTIVNNMGQKLFNVSYVDKVNLATEANPTALTMRCIDAFGFIEELLVFYEKKDDATVPKLPGFTCTDVTDFFYDTVANKNKKLNKTHVKVLKKEMEPSKTRYPFSFSFTHNKLEITCMFPIVLGLDILPRNNLKKIEEDDPKVVLVSWLDSEVAIRYAFVIETDKALGIWSNYFSDRVILPSLL